jgi:hypothetical protein
MSPMRDCNPLPVDPITGRAANAPRSVQAAGICQPAQGLCQAFGAFFARLANAGITKDNTLFLVVPDETTTSWAASRRRSAATGPLCAITRSPRDQRTINRLLATRNPATPAFLSTAMMRRRSTSTAIPRRPTR